MIFLPFYSPVPIKTLQEMNTDEVKKWLIEELRISVSIADKLAEACVDGELLLRYEDQHLQKDFQLPTGVMRKIIYARDYHMKKRAHAQPHLAPASECSDNLNKDAGTTGNIHRSPSASGTHESKRDAQITELTASVKRLNTEDDDVGKSVAVEISQPAPLSKEEESAGEAKLRYLLTGDESGSLDRSFHPVLVVNKPAFEESRDDKLESLKERLDFVSLVNWNAVFDCNPKSREDGVCSMVEEKREIKLLLPETFNKEIPPEEVDFNDVPSWIFSNGRDDLEELQSPSLASDWNEKYGAGVDRAIDYFATNAIPKKRAIVVFLLLSRDSVQVMSDIFKKLQSSLQGQGNFTFIAESQDLFEIWADEVKKWLPRNQLEQRSFIGTEWKYVNKFIQRQYEQFAISQAELPLSDGKVCNLPNKKRSQWLNIGVLPSNECENTDMDEDGPKFKKFVSKQELTFYKGNDVSWWNFHLTEGRGKKQRFNQVLRREVSKTLNELVKSKWKPANPNDGSSPIVTITIFHEPGSGASTTARQVLWDFHHQLRCVIVKRAVMRTVEEILEVRRYGYESSEEPPPALVLLDDMDDTEVVDLIAQLERATNNNDCLSIILLQCKRTPNSELLAKDSVVVMKHELNDQERRWFDDKFKEYEKEYSMCPEKLIGFMVMKEQCNPEYIQRIVSNILREMKNNADKKYHNEAQLLKYIAVINKYLGDVGMPVSCCDEMMSVGERIRCQGGYRLKYDPWEKHLSNATCLLLIQTEVHTKSGPTNVVKVVNSVLAAEVVKQLEEDNGQTIGEIVKEFIYDSKILDSKAYIKSYIELIIRRLLVQRKKIDNDWREKSAFSPLVEHLVKENLNLAFQLLEDTSKKFKSGYIAQQLARLYKSRGKLDEAAQSARMATDFKSDNPFYWDTRGRIIISKMEKYKEQQNYTSVDESEAPTLINLLDEGMCVFKRCQDIFGGEYSYYSPYAGYCGELKVIFLFIHIMELRVLPFCSSSQECVRKLKVYFLTDENLPDLSVFWKYKREHLKELPKRADLVLDKISDLMTFSRAKPTTKQYPEGHLCKVQSEIDLFNQKMLEYFTIDIHQSPPKSVLENSWRRAQVKAMKADSFSAIFKMAQDGKEDSLKEVRSILNANNETSAFDLKLLVCISFALSSLGCEDVDYDRTVKLVQKLNEIDKSLYGAFFAMMLAWPRDDLTARRSDVGMSPWNAVQNLIKKGKSFLRKEEKTPHTNQSFQHHHLNKPLTYFLFAKGEGLQAFLHINEFHASPSTLEDERHKFWSREGVSQQLVRLEGTIKDRGRIVYKTPANEHIYIGLSRRRISQPSQERVSFYLGFNFHGPVAFDVSEKRSHFNPSSREEYQPGAVSDVSRVSCGQHTCP
ncbi:sterile alpha motif domain-containing protein 9-like [Lytechinus pictus]|uniref:sterile alpha motif domain-containing protein 9-like n=1 Tax=Lytechinus pictus TaxID=7653 RepID=UPI0030BA26F8